MFSDYIFIFLSTVVCTLFDNTIVQSYDLYVYENDESLASIP